MLSVDPSVDHLRRHSAAPPVEVEELHWDEVSLGEVDFPKQRLKLTAGFGSGLATRPGQANGEVWAICDRGPNIKLADASSWYGWQAPPEFSDRPGAKLMPRPEVGPSLALLRICEARVELLKTLRLEAGNGQQVSGLPVPEGGHAECEPVLDLDGRHVRPDPNGMDTEGLALLKDGSFWASEEYGPSLVRIDAAGRVQCRLMPAGARLTGAGHEVRDSLPAIAAKRHLNRGFEAVAVSPSDERLFVAFQSPLAHPGKEDHKTARHVRLWELDASGQLAGQYLYPLDDPETFERDEDIDRSDLKICEIAALSDVDLLVLERATETCKIYQVRIDKDARLPPEHLEPEFRPTVEQLSAAGEPLPQLSKRLLFSSHQFPQVCADIEGMAVLDRRSLLIVSDNDFGCEGKQTRFYRLTFDADLL